MPISILSQVDVRGAVPSWVADLMGQDGTIWLLAKVHDEVLVEGQTAVGSVDVDAKELGTLSGRDIVKFEKKKVAKYEWMMSLDEKAYLVRY